VRLALGTDEDTSLVGDIIGHLEASGHEVVVLARPLRWPEVGADVGEAVARREVDMGVVCCWTGTGVSIAANKVPGVRAALCGDAITAAGARKWNDANVVALSLRTTTPAVAAEIIDAFLTTGADPGEADAVAMLR